jgi:hypothetical protein
LLSIDELLDTAGPTGGRGTKPAGRRHTALERRLDSDLDLLRL